jgi:hypothetical protein
MVVPIKARPDGIKRQNRGHPPSLPALVETPDSINGGLNQGGYAGWKESMVTLSKSCGKKYGKKAMLGNAEYELKNS